MTWTSEIWEKWRKWGDIKESEDVRPLTNRLQAEQIVTRCERRWFTWKRWSYRAAAVPADIPRRKPTRDVLKKETRSMKDAFCFLFVRLLLIIICNTQVGLQLLSWAPWNDFTERVFPLAVFYCWISQPSCCTRQVHTGAPECIRRNFFWGGNGMYEMWYRSRSGAACLRVLIYSTTRVRVFFASRPVSSLAHISIYVTTKKTPRPVGLLSLRHSKTKSQASAQKHTWHLQALTHSYDPPALTETQRTRLQLAEAQSCVGVSHFFTSKSQKLTETKNGFKTETAQN